jgi:surface polysaccharide O-acyltransferase-like enzyme
VRVVIPFVIWTLLYIFIPPFGSGAKADIAGGLKDLPFNFVMTASGHLWFVYMLLGVYLLMPLLSPWVEKVSRKGERNFLILWAFTTVLPIFRPLAEAVTGSPDLWGECPWNPFGTFYYVSGFIGFLVLGHYIRKYAGEVSWKKTLAYAVPFWIVGYAVTAGGYWHFMPREAGFPISAPYETAVLMETTWNFCTFGVMMQTVAYFLVIRKITASGWFYERIVLPISKLSYGMYLMHMFALTPVFGWVNSWGIPTPCVMIVSAVITYLVCAVTARLLAFLPKSKYIVG